MTSRFGPSRTLHKPGRCDMITRSLRLLVASRGTWKHFSVADRPTTTKRRARLAVALVATASVAACAGSGDGVLLPRTLHWSARATAAGPATTTSSDRASPPLPKRWRIGSATTKTSTAARSSGLQTTRCPQVDGSNVVVATASDAPSGGGLLVQEDYFCNDYQPQQSGTPATEPLVTSDRGSVGSGPTEPHTSARTIPLEGRPWVTECGPSRALHLPGRGPPLAPVGSRVVSGVREVESTRRAGWVGGGLGCHAGDMSVASAGLWSAGIVMEPEWCW